VSCSSINAATLQREILEGTNQFPTSRPALGEDVRKEVQKALPSTPNILVDILANRGYYLLEA